MVRLCQLVLTAAVLTACASVPEPTPRPKLLVFLVVDVSAFNAARPADRYFKTAWKPLLPESACARSLLDNQIWFAPRGGKLPLMMGVAADDAPGPAFYSALLVSPFGDALALDFARAAIVGKSLGSKNEPDILAVSLSGHDYVNHAYSAESRMSHEHFSP